MVIIIKQKIITMAGRTLARPEVMDGFIWSLAKLAVDDELVKRGIL